MLYQINTANQPESGLHQYDMLDVAERAALSIVARLARCQMIGWKTHIEERALSDTVEIIADEIRSTLNEADADDLADIRAWMGETDQDTTPAPKVESIADVQPLTEGELIALAMHQTLNERAQAALLAVVELGHAIPDVDKLRPIYAAIMEGLDQDVKNDLRKFGDVWAEIRDDKPDQDAPELPDQDTETTTE